MKEPKADLTALKRHEVRMQIIVRRNTQTTRQPEVLSDTRSQGGDNPTQPMPVLANVGGGDTVGGDGGGKCGREGLGGEGGAGSPDCFENVSKIITHTVP